MMKVFGRLLSAIALACAAATAAASAGASTFPCRWKWDLEAGLRPGYVTVGNSAACSGRSGSLTLNVRLLSRTSPKQPWHLDKAQTRTFTDLRHNRYLVLQERCRASTVRAVFGWTLRDSGGAVVGSHSVKTATLKVPGPDCRFAIS